MKIKYSKPVLIGGSESSYNKNIKFDLTIVDNENAIKEDGTIRFNAEVKLTSTVLIELLKTGKAKFGIKVKTSLFNSYKEYNFSENEKYEVCIRIDDLKRIDSIRCTAFIIANEDVELAYNDELLEIYKGDYVFKFHNNEVLAESSSDKLDYQASGSPFIQINAIEDKNDIGFAIKENVINVNVGENFNVAFNKLQEETKKVNPKGILNSFIAYNAIFYSLLKVIVEDDERFYESDWFKALEYNFDNSAVKDLKTYLKNMSEDIRNIDLDSLNETVQKMLHNQLNNKVVEAWEVADGNHSKTN